MPQSPNDLDAIEPWKHDIEDYHVEVGAEGQLEPQLAISGEFDGAPFLLESLFEEGAQPCVVLHQ